MTRTTPALAPTILAVALFVCGVAVQSAEADLGGGQILLLRDAIATGIERNLNLRIDELDSSIRRQDIIEADAAFDPAIETRLYTGEKQILSGTVLYADDYQYTEETGARISLRKRFKPGMQGSVSFQTERSENNALADSINPAYRNFLILNLTQPLLRNFGYDINTTQLRLSRNLLQSAVYDYLDKAQEIAARIEQAYFDLANAQAVLGYRTDSHNLAVRLVRDNRKLLDRGTISISEVQQAETAAADRQEDMIVARQNVQTMTNRLKDLLELQSYDPMGSISFTTAPLPSTTVNYPGAESALTLALKQRLDLQRLHLALKSQDIRLEYYRNQQLPRLDLGATLGLNGLAGDDRPVTLFGRHQTSSLSGDYLDSYSSLAEDNGYQWAIDLKLTYPIGNRAGEARYAKNRIEKQQLIYQLKRLEGSIETSVNNAMVVVDNSLQRVEVAQRFENLAEATLEQEMARLKRGLSDTFRILDFQDDLIRAHIRKTNALTDFHQGLASLYRVLGANLDRYDIVSEIDRDLIDRNLPNAFPAK